MKKFLLIALLAMTSFGCSQNEIAKQFGGTMEVTIPANEKFVNVTWKDTNLWVVTRPRKAGETPETYNFKENSPLGILEGTVKITEQ